MINTIQVNNDLSEIKKIREIKEDLKRQKQAEEERIKFNYESQIKELEEKEQAILNIITNELRSSFGVLFQDFNKYEITFRENVELSNINKNSKNDLAQSINRSGADSVLKKFGNNMETHLGKIYNDGVWKFRAVSGKELQPQELSITEEMC